MVQIATTYQQWKENQIGSADALSRLVGQLDSIDDQLDPLEEHKKVLRAQISEIVEDLGGKVELPGYGALHNMSPSVTASYNREKLDGLVARLVATHPEIAQQISACRTESVRAGSLRITKAKSNHLNY